jgi:nucleotide-binding universal stress UspA family protein
VRRSNRELVVSNTVLPNDHAVPLARRTEYAGPVMVAVGGSDEASALRAVHSLGLEQDTSIIAVTMLESLPAGAMGLDLKDVPAEYHSEERDALLTALTRAVMSAFGPVHRVATRVMYGVPSRAIADAARELNASLLVMGVGRHRPLDRLLGAETTLRTIRRATCPVLAVSPGFQGPPGRVVIATDFSPASARAAKLAIPLLAEHASLHFVHAWQRNELGTARAREIDAAYESALPARFQRLLSVVGPPDSMTVAFETRDGSPAESVLGAAAQLDADLIVAGREGLNFLERLMVGSVTTALLRKATTSLFVARESSFAETDQLQRLLSGRSTSHLPEEWAVQLEAFTRRNSGRRVELQGSYPGLGAESQESGFAFGGATFDPQHQRVDLLFADPAGGTRHMSRSVGHIRAITVITDERGADLGMHIQHRDGETLLSLLAGAAS